MSSRDTGRSSGRVLAIFGLLWLPWAVIFLRSWWIGEGALLEEAYYAARDALQPRGYAISGALRSAPSWTLAHVAVIALPWVAFVAGRWLLGRVRRLRSGI